LPDTLTSLVLFVAMLVPGYAHRTARSRRTPLSPSSQLSETLALLTASLASLTVATAAHEAMRWWHPEWFVNTRELVLNTEAYVATNLGGVVLTFLGVLTVATALAGWVGSTGFTVPGLSSPQVADISAWWRVFEIDVPAKCWAEVGCTLRDDRGFVSGRLAWFSSDTDEHGDRSLALAPPLMWTKEDKQLLLPESGRVVVSAADIVVMEVRYRHDEEGDEANAAGETP
jgi:hypothetical protein